MLYDFKNRVRSVAVVFLFWLIGSSRGNAQELFPLTEPASTLPKKVWGVRLYAEAYKEMTKVRTMSYLRMMYGATPRLSIYLTGIASNHHGEKLPQEFPFHNTPERGARYPYRFNGAHLYAKYRLLSMDGEQQHFRIAAFAEGTWVKTSHHEAEPDLMMGDNSGIGGGLIATYLKRKLATSVTLGYIRPFGISGNSPDPIESLPDVPVRLNYGNTLQYSLSFGYLLFPRQYKNYDQLNVNLYLEMRGKYFGDAAVWLFEGMETEYLLDKNRYPAALRAGWFVDFSPSIQLIIRSNTRLDFSTTWQGMGQSYAKLYPVYALTFQHYIYPRK